MTLAPSRGGRPRRESPLAGTAYSLLAQLSTAVFTAGVTLFLVRALGPRGYGELTLVLSVTGIALVLADAAVAQATGRFLAAAAPDDGRRLAVVLSSGLQVKLVLSAVVALLLVLLAGPIAAAYGAPGLAWPLRAAALAVVAESVVMLWLVSFQAMRLIALNVRLFVVESCAEALSIVSLVLLGAGVTGAVAGRGAGYAVGAVVGVVLMTRVLGHRPSAVGDAATRAEIVGYARPLLVITGTYSAYAQVDVQLVAGLLHRTAVGLYAAPLRILVLLTYPGQAVANAVSPRMAGSEPDVSAFNQSLRWLLLYQTLLVPPVLLWAEPIAVLVLGAEFRGSAPVLWGLTPYLWLAGISTLASTTVNYLGHARRRIPVVLLSLMVNVALCLLLLPRLGVVGAALALSASYALYVPLHVRICRESFPLPLRPQLLTCARAALAAAAFAGVLAAIGRTDLSLLQWCLGVTLGPAAFLATLLVVRELSWADLRAAAAAVHAALGPGRRPGS